MRDGCSIEPAVEFQYKKTKNQTLEGNYHTDMDTTVRIADLLTKL